MSIWNSILTGNYDINPFSKWEAMLDKIPCVTLHDRYRRILYNNALIRAKEMYASSSWLDADSIMYEALAEMSIKQRAYELTINDFMMIPFNEITHAYWLVDNGTEEFDAKLDNIFEKGCPLLFQIARISKMLCTFKKFYYLMYNENYCVCRERFWDAGKWKIEVSKDNRYIRIRSGNPAIKDSIGPDNNSCQILCDILLMSMREYCKYSWSNGKSGVFYNSYGNMLKSACSEIYYDGIFKI